MVVAVDVEDQGTHCAGHNVVYILLESVNTCLPLIGHWYISWLWAVRTTFIGYFGVHVILS